MNMANDPEGRLYPVLVGYGRQWAKIRTMRLGPLAIYTVLCIVGLVGTGWGQCSYDDHNTEDSGRLKHGGGILSNKQTFEKDNVEKYCSESSHKSAYR